MKLILSLFIILLVGCAHNEPIKPIVIDRQITIPERFFEECAPLNKITNPNDLESVLFDNLLLYRECSVKQSNSVKLLRELSNKGSTK